MPENKFLWRVAVRGISKPIYLVAQNMASAHAQAANHPQIHVADVTLMLRVDQWDEAQNMTVVLWPQPPPEPVDLPEPPP